MTEERIEVLDFVASLKPGRDGDIAVSALRKWLDSFGNDDGLEFSVECYDSGVETFDIFRRRKETDEEYSNRVEFNKKMDSLRSRGWGK